MSQNFQDEQYAQKPDEPAQPKAESSASDLQLNKAAQIIWGTLFGGVTLAFLLWTTLQVLFIYRAHPNLFSGPEGREWGVFSGLLSRDWSFSFTNSPPLLILQSLILIGLCVLLGSLILQALDVHITRVAHYATAYLVGFGASGLAFELLIMAKLLYIIPSWLLWVVLLSLGIMFLRLREGRTVWRSWVPLTGAERSLIPFLDFAGKVERGQIQPTGHSANFYHEPKLVRGIGILFLVLTGIFILLTSWHAWFYPETYWDSLILYLGYARMIFLEHKFPIKITAQVGIGLGANYPHLFANYGAMASTMFGGWSDFYQRFIPPIIQLCTAILIYQFMFVTFGRRLVASGACLLLVSIPYGIYYFTAASNYCLAIAITMAFLYTAVLLARTRLPGVFVLFTFWPALAMHVNYLMGILWVPWFFLTLLSFVNFRPLKAVVRSSAVSSEPTSQEFDYVSERFPVVEYMNERGELKAEIEVDERELSSAEVLALNPPSPFGLLVNWRFWATSVICIMLGSSWYVRNYVLTGNPVYAFFPEIFTGSKFINPEVLESAELEWYANGDGVFQTARIFTQERMNQEQGAEVEITAHDVTLEDRLKGAFLFFQGFDIRRLQQDETFAPSRWTDRLYYLSLFSKPHPIPRTEPTIYNADVAIPNNPHAYKLGPLFLGFTLPGILIAVLLIVFRKGALFADLQPLDYRTQMVGLLGSLSVLVLMFAYHFVITDMYLYQIIPIVIPLAIFGSLLLIAASTLRTAWSVFITVFASGLVLLAVLVPGLPFALTNFKIIGAKTIGRTTYNSGNLDHFRNPGMDPSTVYTLRFGADYEMWQRVNQLAAGQKILTHDNRHLMYDPSITLIHLDDWEMQGLYDTTAEEKLEYFQKRGIQYYVQIPNEDTHKINKRLGLDEMIDKGYLTTVQFFGLNRLMMFNSGKENLGNDSDSLLNSIEILPPSGGERLRQALEEVEQ